LTKEEDGHGKCGRFNDDSWKNVKDLRNA